MVKKGQFIASLDHLHGMLTFILNHAQENGLKGEHLTHLELAAEEVLVNIISYAYPDGVQGSIDIACNLLPNHLLEVTIQDAGVPFNPLIKVENFDVEKTIRSGAEGGFGIYLMTKMIDSVAYTRDGDRNILTLCKKCT